MSDSGIFKAAVKLPPEQRAAFLDQACVSNHALRQEVESLLRAHEEAGSFLQSHPDRPSMTADHEPTAERPGSLIGPYKLLQQLGEGGMGVVYMAEQVQPVRRRVALKIIKPGMDSRQVVARFEAERQALALMDHQNIARVLDAGTTDNGRPYFVMELVHGVPVTKYCDENRLTPRQRLALFVPICQAVQHAHQKGIIHRDLKPSNILVTLYDGKPVPKVIDFGVAKAVEQRLTERTLFTQFGTVVGTLEYMAPEQAEKSALGVDTRSDVYALGVLLYELLTGTTPLERKRLRQAAYAELVRLIKEEEPPRPSLRLSSSGAALATISQQRGTEPARLAKLLRGELDWIVMRALEKDRTRRYESANAFARDVERYLNDEAVEACPPSAGYRLRKFARKNKKAFATAAAFVVLLAAAALVSTVLAVRATRAEAEAVQARGEEAARRQEAEEQRQRAEENERQAKAVLAFFQDKVLTAVQPEGREGGLGKDVTLQKAVLAASANLTGAFQSQPLVEASIRSVLAITCRRLGDYALAVQHSERALDLRRAQLGAEHPDTLASMFDLGQNYQTAGKLDRAVPLLDEALRLQKTKLGSEHIDTQRTMLALGQAYLTVGKLAQGLPLVEESFQRRNAILGPNHLRTLNALQSLARAYRLAGKPGLALPLAQDALERMKANLGPEDPYTVVAMSNLAETYLDTGKLDQAVTLAEETLNLRRTHHGPEHPRTLDAMGLLVRAYDAAGKHPEALRLGQELLALQRRELPADDPALAEALATLGRCLLHAQQPAEAEPLLRECLAIRQKKQADLWTTFQALSLLGGSLVGQQKYAEAEPLLGQGYEGLKQRQAKIPGNGKVHLTEALERLVQLYDAWGKPGEAEKWRKQQEEAKSAAKPSAQP
jgi:serine/threonine protein kinase